MKKKLLILLLALAMILTIGIVAIAADGDDTGAEAETITISFMCDQNTTSDTTILDKIAHSDGKITIAKGEKFTLPTTAGTEKWGSYTQNSYVGQEGFHVIWYTENGHVFKEGEEVSFNEDTKLFRCVAKEVYTMAELNYAMENESTAAILMADIDANTGISVQNQGQSVLILNGFTINISKNSSGFMGSQRSGKHIYGEGTINASNPNGKLGEYFFFQDQSHGYNGSANRTVIGVDVTLNCPTMWLGSDGDGSCNNHYPWTRIYGKVNCYGLYNVGNLNNRSPFIEIFDGATLTVNGPQLFKDNVYRNNTNYAFNTQSFELRIYGGTIYLPAEAANEDFWTNDNVADYVDGTINYYNYGGTSTNSKDIIKIFGGSFVLPNNAVPAIEPYLNTDYIGSIPVGGSGLPSNKDTSTYYVSYLTNPGYKLVFEKYTIAEGSYGKLTVTDDIDGSLTGTYYYQMTVGTTTFTDKYESAVKTHNIVSDIKVFELDAETNVYTETDKFALDFGMTGHSVGGSILFKNSTTSADSKLQNLEANSTIFQVVVPADCEHSFTGEPLEATCEHGAYADYNCTVCGHNVYFSWGEKTPHVYEQIAKVEPTATALGSTSFACSTCGYVKTYATTQDPATLEAKVTIKNDDGTFEEITVLANEVFEFSTIGGNGAYIYKVSGIKAFDEYSIRNIYGVVIPRGILYVNITTQNLEKYNNADYGLEVLETSENAIITIHNFANLSCLKTFKVGKGTNIVIEGQASYYNPNGENRSNSKLETVDFSAGDMTVNVMSSAFHDRPVAELLLGENSTYDFQHQSFRNTKITELIIPKTSTLNFGSSSFYDADITSLEFPSGTAEALRTWNIGNDCFRNNPITEITFGEYCTYSFGSSSFNGTKVTTITLAPNSSYTINSWSFSSTPLTKFDASAGKINLTVNGSGLRDLTSITEFLLGEDSTYYFAKESLGKTTYTSLVIPKNSEVTFVEYFLSGNTTFKEIDASAENVTISFNSNSFNGITTFDTLKLGKNATLTFNDNCFKDTALTELELFENSTITFNSYSMRNFAITALDIKKGSTVTFGGNWANGSTIETLSLAGDSNYTFNNGAFTYSTIFTELVFGENTTCRFKDWVFSNANSKITTIDLSAPGANVTLDGSALRSAPTLTTVLFNSDNGTFVINNNAFRESKAITTFKIDGEGSTYTFNGNDNFYTTNITELVLGKNSTYTFGQWMFTGTSQIQKIDASAEGVNVTFDVNSFRGKSTITELLINGKNATYTFNNESFRECSGLTEIVLGEGSTYNFNSGCFNSSNNITRFDGSASGITAIIGNNVFQNKSKITEVSFGPNSSYTIGGWAFSGTVPTNEVVFAGTSTFAIGQEAFRYADFSSITFEDGCDVTFTGANAFLDCDKATSLYIGKNIAITNYPFRSLKALETLYIMSGVTHTSEYEFQNAGSSDFSTRLYVYNHSLDFTFSKGTFDNCDGVILYTATNNIGTRTDVFTGCADGTGYKAWTVYLGIPYPVLVDGVIDPTCEEYGYDTYFCGCGHDCGFYLTETTTVNKYENKHNITASTEIAEQVQTYEVTPIDPKGHDTLGTLLDVVYNSFLEKGTGTYICSACGKTHTVENAVDAIFEWLGYSTNADKNEFAIGYRINHEALEQYETLSGNKLVFGVVGAITENLGGLAPFDEALDPSVKKVSLEIPRENEAGEIAEICFRIQGFKETQMDLGITMAGYVTETTTDEEGNESSTTVYIQSTQTDNPSSNSINNYLASLPTNEEDEVA